MSRSIDALALNDVLMVFLFAPLVGCSLALHPSRAVGNAAVVRGALHPDARHHRSGLATRPAQKRTVGIQPDSRSPSTAVPDRPARHVYPLFAFQSEQIVAQPAVIAILAIPILIQVYFNAGHAYLLSRQFGVAWCVAAPVALIGASNLFELAVAAAISLFGLNSGAALATVVGVLVEVPVMLSVVKIVQLSRGWYESRQPDKAAIHGTFDGA